MSTVIESDFREPLSKKTTPVSLSVQMRHEFPTARLNIAFEVETPGVTALFGPSGSGKSTLLLAAAGLLKPNSTRIVVDDQILADTEASIWRPPEQRRVGLVFQDAKLFPHMSVLGNLRFGMRRAPETVTANTARFDEVIDVLGIGALLTRRPHTLSAGERQRVAIGRALLARPRLLLMDEPLANLDAARKSDILPYLSRLKSVARLPIIYVTHAMDEVAQLADTIVLIEAGQVIASGALTELSSRADLPLAYRDDSGAILLCRIAAHDRDRSLTRLDGGGATFWVPLIDQAINTAKRIRVPAREVILAGQPPEAISLHNIIAGTVRHIFTEPMRHIAFVEIGLPSGSLLARVTPDAVARLGLATGSRVLALIKSTSIEVLGA